MPSLYEPRAFRDSTDESHCGTDAETKLLKILIAAFISSGAYCLYTERHANQSRGVRD